MDFNENLKGKLEYKGISKKDEPVALTVLQKVFLRLFR
jgi:hypothetical protein